MQSCVRDATRDKDAVLELYSPVCTTPSRWVLRGLSCSRNKCRSPANLRRIYTDPVGPMCHGCLQGSELRLSNLNQGNGYALSAGNDVPRGYWGRILKCNLTSYVNGIATTCRIVEGWTLSPCINLFLQLRLAGGELTAPELSSEYREGGIFEMMGVREPGFPAE